jgi:hypothetical protein
VKRQPNLVKVKVILRQTVSHIFAKRKRLGLSLTKMYWLVGRKSKLSTNNKLLIYKVILKPIWTYGIQLWGTTSNSNIEILEDRNLIS